MRINCQYCGALASNKVYSNCPKCGAPLPKKPAKAHKPHKEQRYSPEHEEVLKDIYKNEPDPRPKIILKIFVLAAALFLVGFLFRSSENVFVLFAAFSAATLFVDAAILMGYLSGDDGRSGF